MAKIVTKPEHGSAIVDAGVAAWELQIFFDDLVQKLNDNVLGQAVQHPSYTVAEANALTISPAGGAIYVSDETGGGVLAFSDGTNWRRVTDRAVIS